MKPFCVSIKQLAVAWLISHGYQFDNLDGLALYPEALKTDISRLQYGVSHVVSNEWEKPAWP